MRDRPGRLRGQARRDGKRSGTCPDAKRRWLADHRDMRINLLSRRNGRRAKHAGYEIAQTLSVASQMALLCPSGMDAWMRHELAAGVELPRNGSTPRR